MPYLFNKGSQAPYSVKNSLLVFTGALGILLLTIFIILRFHHRDSYSEQERRTLSLREDVNRHLETQFHDISRALSKQPVIFNLFGNHDEQAASRATSFLNATREILGVSLIYILDMGGTVIASSVSETGISIVGNNYRFRPYYTETIKGKEYYYPALGVTTKKRGLYFSNPIRSDTQEIIGVAVIKSSLKAIDSILDKNSVSGPTAILSSDGVIFSSSEKSWLFHTATALEENHRTALINTGQFADKPLTPLPVSLKGPQITYRNKKYTLQTQNISLEGWKVLTLSPQKSPFFLIVLICFCFTVPLYFFFLRMKHIANESRFQEKINTQNTHLRKLNTEMKKEIDERIETEKKLKRVSEQELRYRMLFEQSKDAITIVSEDGKFLEANKAFLQMMDCTQEDITTITPKDFWYNQNDRLAWLSLLKEQGSIIDYLSRQVTRKGTVLDLNLTTNATQNRDGKTVYLTILRDITDQIADQKNLLVAKKTAEEGSKAKSDFLANMSHEIRTPMNGIIGMTNIVLETRLNNEQRNYLEMVRTSAHRLLDIINNILDFSKIEAGKLELEETPFNLLEKCDELVSLMLIKANNNNVDLTAKVKPGVPVHLLGDPTRLMQILINLTNNAIKFTRDGNVDITVSQDKILTPNRVALRFSIQDTGIGVSPQKQRAIFDSFSQADSSTTRKYGGTGLGLTISSQLCKLMGGKIGLESEQDKGSHFWFTAVFNIPDIIEEKSEYEHGKIISSELTREEIFKDIRILLAEDDYINRTLALAVLEKAQLKVTAVSNGHEAVVESAENSYDLILMDIQMPIMDGYDATRAIREREMKIVHHTPIIAMTAHAIVGDREKCLDAGMDDYITKPIDPAKLYTLIENHLLYRALVADGHHMNLNLAGRIFTEIGWQVTLAENSSQCLSECSSSSFDLILIDLLTADINLEEIVKTVEEKNREKGKRTHIAAISSVIDRDIQSRCSNVNIQDIIEKPLTKKAITTMINNRKIIK